MRDRILKLHDIMKFIGIDCWLLYTDEHSDPYFSKMISDKVIVPCVAIFTQSKCHLIINSLDADNFNDDEGINISVYSNSDNMWECINNVISGEGFPAEISLNYSTLYDAQVDVMGHGIYLYLTERIHSYYKYNNKEVEFSSAEKIIYAYFDRKESFDIARMKVAAARALEILEIAFSKLRIGMTEKDVVALVHNIMIESPCVNDQVMNEEFSWNKDYCPVVLSGPSLLKGGHAMPSDLVLRTGYTIYFDFGVTLTFTDGSKWSSDIQRMGYFLNVNELEPPEPVKKMFNTLVTAIENGMKHIRPGMKGYEVDRIVRSYITEAGYPDYDHSTGHAIGALAHNPGALLGPKGRSLANLEIQPNGVYTIEPRIPIENGGSIEEMILVTNEGGVPLCKPQKELYLIRNSIQE